MPIRGMQFVVVSHEFVSNEEERSWFARQICGSYYTRRVQNKIQFGILWNCAGESRCRASCQIHSNLSYKSWCVRFRDGNRGGRRVPWAVAHFLGKRPILQPTLDIFVEVGEIIAAVYSYKLFLVGWYGDWLVIKLKYTNSNYVEGVKMLSAI